MAGSFALNPSVAPGTTPRGGPRTGRGVALNIHVATRSCVSSKPKDDVDLHVAAGHPSTLPDLNRGWTARSGLAGASTSSLTASGTNGCHGPIRGRYAIPSRRRLPSWSASVLSGLEEREPSCKARRVCGGHCQRRQLRRMGGAGSVRVIRPLRPYGRGGRDHGRTSPSVQDRERAERATVPASPRASNAERRPNLMT